MKYLLYILTGQDDFSLNQTLEEIKRQVANESLFETSTTVLDGKQATLDQLRNVCETAPFFTGKRLVIIKGLLEHYGTGGKSRRQSKSKRNNQKEQPDSIAAVLKNVPESTVLVLLEDKITGSNTLFNEIAEKAVVRSFPLLKDAQLRQWIRSRIAEEGGSISQKAIDLLVRLIGSNLWIMSSELEKLVLFSEGRRIEEEDVTALVGYIQQVNVFAMVDAIIESKVELAEKSLHNLLQQGVAPVYLLYMLSRQIQMILRVRELRNQKKSKAEMQNRLGLTSEYALRKTIEQSGRYSLPRLTEMYQYLLEADLSIKTGKYSGELALDILIAELCNQDSTGRTKTEPVHYS